MSEGTTRETKLTDSEAKMLRELAMSERSTRAALTKLLLAAKEKAASIADDCRDTFKHGDYTPGGAIRNSDFGDLFEVK